MADTLGKIVARVPASTSSTSNLFADERALTAGTGHIFVVSDLNHLMNISATGPTFTHQGMSGFYRGPNGTMSSPPLPGEVMWTPPGVDAGAFNLRVLFRVDPYDTAVLPIVRLRCWVKAPPSGTESVGVVLCVGQFLGDQTLFDSVEVTNTAGEDVTLEVQPRAQDLYQVSTPVTLGYLSSGVAPLAEPHVETVVQAWVGFINTSNKNSDTADALGIVVSLEIPP